MVDDIVRDIRTAHGGLKNDLVKVGPWEGHEGELIDLCGALALAKHSLMPAYEGFDYTGSQVSVVPIRNRTPSPRSANFNAPAVINGDDDDIDSADEMGMDSGSDSGSSGTISIMTSQRPAVDVFVERFVDAFSPEVDIKSGRAGALRAAAGIRMFSPLIADAFEAVSVAFFGRSVRNKELEASGFRLYPRVLRGLQDALLDPERSKSEATLVTVTLLLAFEVCHFSIIDSTRLLI